MKLEHIKIAEIDPNPNNPRGIDIATQDPKLPLLKNSIDKFGVMVPIVVAPRKGRYLLIDGERRFIAAIDLGIKKIPAYITKMGLNDSDVLFRMFQIHHNREQWDPIQQCHALEPTYRQISSRKRIKQIEDERAKIQAIAEDLSDATGIEIRTAIGRIKFLRWPDTIKKPLYEAPTDDYWYICEIEDKIIIPSLRNYPEYFEKVPVDEVRTSLYEKLKHHSVSKSTEVRQVSKVFATSMVRNSDRKKVKSILAKLHKNYDMTYAEAWEEFIKEFPESVLRNPPSPRRLLTMIMALETSIQDFNLDDISSAKRRAKASAKELAKYVLKLQETLTIFTSELAHLQGLST